jgi:hypothetical protein
MKPSASTKQLDCNAHIGRRVDREGRDSRESTRFLLRAIWHGASTVLARRPRLQRSQTLSFAITARTGLSILLPEQHQSDTRVRFGSGNDCDVVQTRLRVESANPVFCVRPRLGVLRSSASECADRTRQCTHISQTVGIVFLPQQAHRALPFQTPMVATRSRSSCRNIPNESTCNHCQFGVNSSALDLTRRDGV